MQVSTVDGTDFEYLYVVVSDTRALSLHRRKKRNKRLYYCSAPTKRTCTDQTDLAFFRPGSRGFHMMRIRFGGYAPGLLGSREHPWASQAGYRRMTTQNRCSIEQYDEDSLASIRLPPLRCQPPHACAVCQPSPNRFVFTVRRRHSKEGKDNSPAEEHGPPFAVNLHDTHVLALRCTRQSTQNAVVDRASANNPKSIEDIGPKISTYGKDGGHPGASCQAVVRTSLLQRRAGGLHKKLMVEETILCCRCLYRFGEAS